LRRGSAADEEHLCVSAGGLPRTQQSALAGRAWIGMAKLEGSRPSTENVFCQATILC
jgi:hypothetical protein